MLVNKDFSYIVFYQNKPPEKYKHVNNPFNLWKNLAFKSITVINVYKKSDRTFYTQIKNQDQAFHFFMQHRQTNY